MDSNKANESLLQRITLLRQDLKTCSQEVVAHVTSLYAPTENNPNVNLKNDPRNAIKMLQQEVLDCLETAQDRGNYREKFAADVESCRSLMEIINHVSVASEKIVRCDEAVGGVDLKLACQLIGEVKKSLEMLPGTNTELGTGAVCRVLCRESRLLNARFQAKLRRLLSTCIVCECGRLNVTKRLKGMLRGCGEEMILDDSMDLSDIWACLVSIHGAKESVHEVIDSVWQALIKPLWKERRAQSPHVYVGEEHSELVFDNVVRDHSLLTTGSGASSASISLGACRMPLPQLLDQIQTVLTFVVTEVFVNNNSIVELAAIQFTPQGSLPLMTVLMETLTTLVPKNENELSAFQRLIEKPCKDFENKLDALGLLTTSSSSSSSSQNHQQSSHLSPLTNAVQEMRCRFADMRRKEILGRGRDLLLSDYHNTMMANGDANEDDPASAGNVGDPTAMLENSGCSVSLKSLHFESCQVSLAACRVLKLIHEVMKQACLEGTSPSLATMLYQSSRDCLELFLAIVPVRFADVIDTVPRMGAVLYNDCCYLAHNCTLITHMYKEDLGKIDKTLQENAGFIDFIPRFRALGEKCLVGHLDEQKATLLELLQRIHLNPTSERSLNKTNGQQSHGVVSVGGFIAPRVVGAVGAVGAAVGGAFLKQIGGISSMGMSHFGQDRGSNNLTLTGALQEAAANNNVTTGKNMGSSGSTIGGKGHGIDNDVLGHGGSGLGGQMLHENDEESATLVVRHLERLRGQWQGVLQDVVYERVVGYLLEGILRTMMKSVLEADCITETACGDIGRLYRVLQRGRIVFPAGATDDEAMSKVVPSWGKFCALTDLLEYSLSEVAEWLPRRKFASFTGSEMTGLIKALYEDSSRRQGILKSILEMTS